MKSKNNTYAILDKIFNAIFLICACIAVIAVFSITIFIFARGIQPFLPGNAEGNYSLIDFITGLEWKPSTGTFGIGYMIIASIFSTIGALVIGVPISIFTAVFIAELAPKKIAIILRSVIELLASIPSVLYGVFGYAVIIRIVRLISPYSIGDSMLSVILILSMMVLPTIVSISENAIRAVPSAYKEAAYGLGARKTEVIFKTILPAAKSGILAAVVLGVGRAIGETMAVILVAGNPEGNIPTNIFDQVRLITNNIVLEQGYAEGLHEEMLFATGSVLFLFIVIVNLTLYKIQKGMSSEK